MRDGCWDEAQVQDDDLVQKKAEVLIEALPYIRMFYGKTFVVKYGGHAMADPELKRDVILDIVLLKYIGINPVVVHGGGNEISELMVRLGIKPCFVNGLRVTDAQTIEIVEMVLVGKVNKQLVSLINQNGGKAVGVSGKDGNLIVARKRIGAPEPGGTQFVDLGYVGDVERVNPGMIHSMCAEGFIPVVAPVAAGEDGQTYNINADHVAGHLAAALKADKLIILTDVEGIYDAGPQRTLLSSITVKRARELMRAGVINGGMIPKVEACIVALESGVTRTHIIDGRKPHSLLLEIFTNTGIGSMVIAGQGW